MTDTIRQLSDAYSKSEPNELEKRLEQQKQAGAVPEGWEQFVMQKLGKIPNDPTVARLKWAQINPGVPFPEPEVQS